MVQQRSDAVTCLTLCRMGLVPRFIEFLALQHPNNNVHNLRVARLAIAGGALPPDQLEALCVPDRVRPVRPAFPGLLLDHTLPVWMTCHRI